MPQNCWHSFSYLCNTQGRPRAALSHCTGCQTATINVWTNSNYRVSVCFSKKMTKPYIIRDPVHGYLTVAPHEQVVIDHPVTQRLRRINQTGVADLVFPEARSSRFVHSLGAMHLASRFVVACLTRCQERTALHFFRQIERLPYFKNFQLDIEHIDSLTDHHFPGGGLLAVNAVFSH